MICLVETNYEEEKFYVREIEADAVGVDDNHFALLSPLTDREIIDYSNNQLTAPESGNFDSWEIERE